MNENYFKEGYAIKDQFATHFLTLTVCGWIDLGRGRGGSGRRPRITRRREKRETLSQRGFAGLIGWSGRGSLTTKASPIDRPVKPFW